MSRQLTQLERRKIVYLIKSPWTMWWNILLCVGLASARPLDQSNLQDEFERAFPEVNSGLFEGDIELLPGQNPHDRNGVRNHTLLWPNGIIPYAINTDEFTPSQQAILHRAMQTIMDTTRVNGKLCITFVPRTTEASYIRYQSGSGCHTPVGRRPTMTGVTIGGIFCMNYGTAIHETMHAMGFWHEQNRRDRDNYVTILWENIMKGHEHNFDKYPEELIDDLDEPYDYDSVMHYPTFAFTKDFSKSTIIPKQPGVLIGQRTHISALDIQDIQVLYGCIPRPHNPNSSTTTTPVNGNGPTTDAGIMDETCDFEKDFCHWTNVNGTDQTDWTRYTGHTPSLLTGPNSDHSGSALGHYLYVEASGHIGQTAILQSRTYPQGYYCLAMFYHMNGLGMGSIVVHTVTDTNITLVKTDSGDHGNMWNHWLLDLHETRSSFKVEIKATVGASSKSDIAIDDLKVHFGKCSTLGRRDVGQTSKV